MLPHWLAARLKLPKTSLILAKQEPSDQEFVSLLTNHQEVLRSFVLSLIPNHPGVRDLVQEINIVLWEKRKSFELGTNFGAWINTVARFKAMNERKKLQRANWLVFNNNLIDLIAGEGEERDPELLESKRRAFNYCFQKLRKTDQSLLTARYTSSEAMENYARSSGRTRASLRVTLTRLRATVRHCIHQRLAMEKGGA